MGEVGGRFMLAGNFGVGEAGAEPCVIWAGSRRIKCELHLGVFDDDTTQVHAHQRSLYSSSTHRTTRIPEPVHLRTTHNSTTPPSLPPHPPKP